MQSKWYEKWFDSPFYHVLYKDRNLLEAQSFIDRLLEFLKLQPPANVLDLACGKGRHSRYLAEKGFEVTGIDLSDSSIQYAQSFEQVNLSFYRHDMRDPFRINYFDATFNFFTSFGYFESPKDDLLTIQNVANGLKNQGLFVLDFMNAPYVKRHLKTSSEKIVDGIHFHIERSIEGVFVVKKISFDYQGSGYLFEERVRLLSLEEFKALFDQVGLKLFYTFGNYQLDPFVTLDSPRLILVARKM